MIRGQRALDLVVATLLTLFLWPVAVVVTAALLLREGRPVFYLSERMTTPTRAFTLVKFRTMRVTQASKSGVTGGDKQGRLSGLHRFLRATRADELPQIWNVFRGDISLVGPRPPLRVYVEDYPEVYGPVLAARPGVTGLASLVFHKHEERLLAQTQSAAETDAVYRQRCIPRKAHLDLMYQRNRTLCSDLMLIGRTAAKPFRKRKD
jgi:lipopolysaccharide/colanic/teichoic acid biosynthesis glycosyltransferase